MAFQSQWLTVEGVCLPNGWEFNATMTTKTFENSKNAHSDWLKNTWHLGRFGGYWIDITGYDTFHSEHFAGQFHKIPQFARKWANSFFFAYFRTQNNIQRRQYVVGWWMQCIHNVIQRAGNVSNEVAMHSTLSNQIEIMYFYNWMRPNRQCVVAHECIFKLESLQNASH